MFRNIRQFPICFLCIFVNYLYFFSKRYILFILFATLSYIAFVFQLFRTIAANVENLTFFLCLNRKKGEVLNLVYKLVLQYYIRYYTAILRMWGKAIHLHPPAFPVRLRERAVPA